MWPVDTGTKLTMFESNELAGAGFVLVKIDPRKLKVLQHYRGQHIVDDSMTINCGNDRSRRPIRRAGKRVNRRSLTETRESRREAGMRMTAQVRLVENNFQASCYKFQLYTISTTTNKPLTYVVTISEFPACICQFFIKSVADPKLGLFYMTCKHMYHIYNKVLGLPISDNRPYQPSLNKGDVEDIVST
ncbi:hypothetical protein M758_UG046300 [Ceratodon purpureus]|nr:hypothetical protein M758_UG046300 [Ceratodon purpureus]